MVNPYAICEWSSINTGFMRIVREYRYMDMDAFSITCDDVTGFIMYHGGGSIKNVSNRNARQPSKARLFYIQRNRNARTDLIHFIKMANEKIGCMYNISESVTLEYVLERHAQYGKRLNSLSSTSSKVPRTHLTFDILGHVLSTYRVTKPSMRHPETVEGMQLYLQKGRCYFSNDFLHNIIKKRLMEVAIAFL